MNQPKGVKTGAQNKLGEDMSMITTSTLAVNVGNTEIRARIER